MSLLASLLLLQAAPAEPPAPERTPELDAANDCSSRGLANGLKTSRARPMPKSAGAGLNWSLRGASRRSPRACLQSLPTPGLPCRYGGKVPCVNISRSDLRRTEALYYVDGMIAAHFEEEAQ